MAKLVYKEIEPKANGDCVINALCILTGNPWRVVYKELCNIGFKICDMPDCNRTTDEYCKKKKWVKTTVRRCMTVDEFAEINACGAFFVLAGNHACAVIDGVILDEINSSKYKVRYAFKVR